MKSKLPAKQAENHLSIESTRRMRARVMGPSREDPYQGAMTAKRPSRKKDLRKLGEWIKAKQLAEQVRREHESLEIDARKGDREET